MAIARLGSIGGESGAADSMGDPADADQPSALSSPLQAPALDPQLSGAPELARDGSFAGPRLVPRSVGVSVQVGADLVHTVSMVPGGGFSEVDKDLEEVGVAISHGGFIDGYRKAMVPG